MRCLRLLSGALYPRCDTEVQGVSCETPIGMGGGSGTSSPRSAFLGLQMPVRQGLGPRDEPAAGAGSPQATIASTAHEIRPMIIRVPKAIQKPTCPAGERVRYHRASDTRALAIRATTIMKSQMRPRTTATKIQKMAPITWCGHRCVRGGSDASEESAQGGARARALGHLLALRGDRREGASLPRRSQYIRDT